MSRVFPPDEGGVQTYARAVALGYAQLGWRVHVFTKTSVGPRHFVERGLTITDVGPGSKNAVYFKLAWAMLKARWRAHEHPDAVHACTWRSARVPALFRFAPLTVTVHGREIGRPRGKKARRMRRVLSSAARIVAVSAWTQRQLLARAPELASRCVVAWNGTSDFVRDTSSSPRDGDEPTVLTVCRLVPRKNLRAAINAAAQCLQRGLKFRYRIAGRGPEAEGLQAEIDSLGIGDRVQLLGFVPDAELPQLYASADVFLHPQIELEDGAEMEGFGITIADAMASALPCIVGANGGPAELIEQDVTGHLVDANSVTAIADSLSALLSDRALRERLGRTAQVFSHAHFQWEQHCRGACGAPLEHS